MALSGGSSKVFGSQNSFRLRIAWSATQNIAGNSSTVTAILYMESLLSWAKFSDGTQSPVSININGNVRNFTNVSTINGNQSRELGRHSAVVAHNGDGTKSFSISASHAIDITYSSSYLGTQSTSGTYALNTIARASSIRLNKTTTDIGTVVRITIGRASSGFTHDLRYSFGNRNVTFASKINYVDYDWTVPNDFLTLINTASSGWGRLFVDTFSGATKIGTAEVKLTVTVPSGYVPTFSSVSITDLTTSVNNLVGAGVYVQSLSNIRLAINGATGVVGSTISSYSITFDGRTWGSQTANVGNISKSGTVSGSAYVTDSRGRRSASKSFSYSFLPYAPPTISTATVSRTLGGLGENIIVNRVGRISGLAGKNKVTAYLDYKVKSSPTWLNIGTLTKSGGVGVEAFSFTDTTTGNIFGALNSYDFRINIHDSITKTTANLSTSTASATLSFGKNGIGIGKIHEGFGTLEVAGTVMANGYGSTQLASGTNLNNITNNGWSHVPSSADASTFLNSPTALAFSLFVEQHAGVKQTLTEYRENYPRTFIRNHYNGYWGDWEITHGEDYAFGLARENGWGIYGGQYQTPVYSRSSGGLVSLSGMLDGGSRTAGVRIATLPDGYRPRARQIFNIHAWDKTYTRLDITVEGYILMMDSPKGYVSLSGITFLAKRF